MWLTLALKHWYLIVIGCLLCALSLMTLHSRALKAERDEKIAVIDFMKREAESYRAQSEIAAEEINDAFTTLTDQIKGQDLALLNAKKRFGSCNVAGGITAVRLPDVPAGTGEADRPETTHATEPELVAVDRPFIDHCALDAGRLQLWQQWAIANDLPVQ